MELYEVGIEYEGMYALFSTLEKAQAFVAKQDAQEKAHWEKDESNGKYRSSWYISTVVVDEQEV